MLFVPAYNTLLDNNGNPNSGAVCKFYVSGSTTPATVYADADLATSLGSVVQAEAGGRPATNIYLDDSVTYRVVVELADGTPLADVDPYIIGAPGTDPVFSDVVTIASAAAAPAYEPTADVLAIQTAGYYEQGDGGQGLYVRVDDEPAHDGKLETADGSFWELVTTEPNVRQFGAKAIYDVDPTFSDTFAFNRLVRYVRLKSTQKVTVNGGAQSWKGVVPQGEYHIDGPVNPVTNPGGITWTGNGYGAKINITANGTIFDFDPYKADAIASFTASGSQSVFTFTLPYGARPQDIWVYDDSVRKTADFTIAVVGDQATATFTGTLPSGALVFKPAPYDVFNAGFDTLTIVYPNTPGTTANVARFSTTTNCGARNVNLRNVGQFAQLGDSTSGPNSSDICSGFVLSNVYGSLSNTAHPFVDVQRGAGLYVDTSVDVFVLANLPDQSSGAIRTAGSTLNSNLGRIAYKVGSGSWDTMILAGTYLRFNKSFAVNTVAGATIINIHGSSCIFDYNKTTAIEIICNANTQVGNIRFSDGYYVGWDDCAIRIQSTGRMWGIDIEGGQVTGAGADGVRIQGVGATYIGVRDLNIYGSGRLSSLTGACGVSVSSDASHVHVSNCTVQTEPTVPSGYLFTWAPPFGIIVDSTVNVISVTDNDFKGSTRNYEVEVAATLSQDRIITGNKFANYAGYKAAGDPVFGSTFAAPASGVTWQNKTGFYVDVHITATAAASVSISKNTQTIVSGSATTLNTMLCLAPGDTFVGTFDSITTKFFVKS